MSPTILVRGSHGELVVHRASGKVLECRLGDSDDDYSAIMYFDPYRLPPEDETDILATAFIDGGGVYVPELSWWPDGHDGHWFVEPLLLTYQGA